MSKNQNQECCPKFDPKPWDGKIFTWRNKKFIKAPVFTLFYVPINFGVVIRKLMAKIETAGAEKKKRWSSAGSLVISFRARTSGFGFIQRWD